MSYVHAYLIQRMNPEINTSAQFNPHFIYEFFWEELKNFLKDRLYFLLSQIYVKRTFKSLYEGLKKLKHFHDNKNLEPTIPSLGGNFLEVKWKCLFVMFLELRLMSHARNY